MNKQVLHLSYTGSHNVGLKIAEEPSANKGTTVGKIFSYMAGS